MSLDTQDKREKLVERLKKSSCFAFDTETDSLNPLEAGLVGMSFAFKAKEAFYVPVPAEREAAQVILDDFKPIFEDENIEKVAQNIKYDMLVLRKYDIRVAGFFWDTMILHYPTSRTCDTIWTSWQRVISSTSPFPLKTSLVKKERIKKVCAISHRRILSTTLRKMPILPGNCVSSCARKSRI